MMDVLPKTREMACVEQLGGEGIEEDYMLADEKCMSAFGWVSGVWGGLGMALTVILLVGVARENIKWLCRRGEEIGGGLSRSLSRSMSGGVELGECVVCVPGRREEEEEEEVPLPPGLSPAPSSLPRSAWSSPQLAGEGGWVDGRPSDLVMGCGCGISKRPVRSLAHFRDVEKEEERRKKVVEEERKRRGRSPMREGRRSPVREGGRSPVREGGKSPVREGGRSPERGGGV